MASSRGAAKTRDHPHTCGEHQSRGRDLPVRQGITPTPVGNTVNGVIHMFGGRDHPHTCGEHAQLVLPVF